MLISTILIALLTFAGLAITYVVVRDQTLLWRLAAGNVIGSALFGTVLFAVTSGMGLTPISVIAALVIALGSLAIFAGDGRRKELRRDYQRARGKLDGANAAKFGRFAYYSFFLILFILFFGRAMWENDGGIFTGGSQNLGDLPFHLGAIFSFTEGANFPPQNPSFAGARFSYPFITDLLTAAFVKLGARVDDAMFVQNVSWAFSLLVILENFVLKLTADRLAARLAPWLLFFSGGLGFFGLLSDASTHSGGVTHFLLNLPRDYTIGETYRWGNSLVVLFMTQRSLLLGMPLTVLILTALWRVFDSEREAPVVDGSKFSIRDLPLSIFVCGLLAGMLPLVHLHSLAVLFVVGVALFVLQPEKWQQWLSFAAGVAVIAVPQIIWSLSGSASDAGKFAAWHFGWDKGQQNFLWFWLINTGIFIPTAGAGMWLAANMRRNPETGGKKHRKGEVEPVHAESDPLRLLWFSLPFVFLFVVSNVVKLAPWEWDNIKILIYWFVGMLPFAAIALAWIWRQPSWGRPVTAAVFAGLIFSGALDVWRTVTRQVNIRVFDHEAVTLAGSIKNTAAPRALFLNAPTYNSAAVLTGRPSVMRYIGHLSSHGINYSQREADVKAMYRGGPQADSLLRSYGIDYVIISAEERNSLQVNESYFAKYPVAAESGNSRIYRVSATVR